MTSPVNTQTPVITSPYQLATPAVSSENHSNPSRVESTQHEDAVFLGESSSLRYVTEEPTAAAAERQQSCFRHSLPRVLRAAALIPEWETARRVARKKALQAEGAFSFPPAEIRVELLEAYFKRFHPHFAILDEEDFWKSYHGFEFSALLLQAMMFIGVIHCEESTLTNLGWGNRHRAKWFFYIRAKDIYDATVESNKIVVIQSLFLMSFWRAGPLLEKDARYWLGTAISLSETRALHRSGGDTNEKLTRLKRRLWWAIYVRERQCAAALGLPCRIRDKDCDIEPLLLADFTSAFKPLTSPDDRHCYTTYAISMVQLAVFLGRVVDAGYLPNRTLIPEDRSRIRDDLYRWRKDLPPPMQMHTDTGDPPNFQACMLHLAYNNLLILLDRTSFILDENAHMATDGNVALQAAARNSRIVEDMLPHGNIGHAQMHVITNLFNTLCIHVVNFRRSTGINRTLAEHRAKLCLLGLQELQKTWEVTNWVLQLFFQYLDRETASRLGIEADEVLQPGGAQMSVASTLTQQQQPLIDGVAPRCTQQAGGDVTPSSNSPKPSWSWTLDEADQYLFMQIENDFAFGEGGLQQWGPEG
ncbi:cutinase transcription factor 1 alpha [Pyrenophora seminiperda CCB06]|uniref:Cutinase transcription factor 1 alpha n=1 Tax=Pyrenophora seminiperda CCB06 TaxID=1302712 RepID=A0A3M7MGL6_9PLEO|nr:cutinase transcription factor 1 alpha [Pyrenophora seminiperda CCB06]